MANTIANQPSERRELTRDEWAVVELYRTTFNEPSRPRWTTVIAVSRRLRFSGGHGRGSHRVTRSSGKNCSLRCRLVHARNL